MPRAWCDRARGHVAPGTLRQHCSIWFTTETQFEGASSNGKRKADRARWRAADIVVVVEHVLDGDEYVHAIGQRSTSHQVENGRPPEKQGVEVVFVLRTGHSELSRCQPNRVVVPHVESHVVICDLWRVIVSEAGVALES